MIHGTVCILPMRLESKISLPGSSCIYPRDAKQPITEEEQLTGPLEETNEWYAIAKIAGIKLCQAYRRQFGCNFISAMPTNLYGPGDNFDLTSSHVIPALMRKFHDPEAPLTKVSRCGALVLRCASSCTSMISRAHAVLVGKLQR